MPTNRGLWRNLQTPLQNLFLEKLSANYRRPAPEGAQSRLDATPVRHSMQAFANQLLRIHKIVLIEHDYPKTGDPARNSRFSVRIPAAADGTATVPVTLNYDGTSTGVYATQNLVGQFPYTADGSYTVLATGGSTDLNGRRRVKYPVTYPLVVLNQGDPPPKIEPEIA
jgi:hypothetical protein